ncbi:anhydro-N-acetylmuramic acid kinase [Isoptericola halotolerans]|uniref:Anhydro-N-acetylmuramic acid kinase n=1 Tax=Isoptericola halotolerans TaxID=300560 RepID=A0ABX2A7H9_9MICO|nr:anhydro-N-acetylmuramic acid kinase [Isoptericola halotolerans]NOV98827.1 anhydro-N-acetylmuramic acid kinase [Isoptericola halotolerans]
MLIAGVMTGTSVDGLDVALVDLDQSLVEGRPELAMHVRARREVPFPDDLALDILRLLEPRDVPMSLASSVDARLGQACADAVAALCADTGVTCDLVVMHGQTVRHDVAQGVVTATWQLGQPAWVAERTGCPVLSDVRSRDVAAGGQGAPLAGVLDHLLLADVVEPTAMLNLGGIANLTVVAPGRETIAFDSGPANALVDLMARRVTGDPRGFDRDGLLAARGAVVPELLFDLLREPYYARPAPKSTGKELFHAEYLDHFLGHHPGADPYDVVATLTRLTARTVADACRAHDVRAVVASGGGTRNPALTAALRDELGPAVPLRTTDEALGLPEGAKEACLMALVGWLTWHGLPATLPSVTGASHATVAGRLSPGAAPLRLPEPLDVAPAALRVR